MIYIYIIFALSLLGVFAIPLFRIKNPNDSQDNEADLRRFKYIFLGVINALRLLIVKSLSGMYFKSLELIKRAKFLNFIWGQGVLEKREVSSEFLKDVREHRDKMREELENETNKETEEIDRKFIN